MDHYQADLVVTDPPYNIDYTGKTKKVLEIQSASKSDEKFFGSSWRRMAACST